MLRIEYATPGTTTWKEATARRWKTRRGARKWLKGFQNLNDGCRYRIAGDEEHASRTPAIDPKGWVHVGDIFHLSFGYDMTINEFYEVVAVSKTGKTCTVRQIASITTGNFNDPAGCSVSPQLTGDRFVGDPIKGKRVSVWESQYGERYCSINMGGGYGSAFLMEPEDYLHDFYENRND